MPEYIVSACLAGRKCRYNGTDALCPAVDNLIKSGEAIPICPEELGGFSTPREPAEQLGDKVITKSGQDVTEQFAIGAAKGAEIAIQKGCAKAILKSKSPSCGVGQVYDGTFSGTLKNGDGVFASTLKKAGIQIKTENEI